jgi:parallel beta-helix repeat protein
MGVDYKMNKTVLPSITILCLLFTTFLIGFKTSVNASPDIIHVPADYAKIQWAIGNATDGDTIIVSAGIYYEHITLDKSLTLQGENKNSTIDGNNTGHVVTITANNVNISGFTIRNSGLDFWDSGIYTCNSSWCNISHNVLIHNGHGLWLDNYSDNNILTANNVSHNLVGIGITISHNNIFTSNYVFSSMYCGIGLGGANSNIFADNTASNNDYGIWLDYSSNVTVTGNTFSNNLYGIHLNHSDNNIFFHNNIINNTHQPQIINSTSIWDADFEGNYWSNYVGVDTDKDGIANNPYIIDANNTDNYPLMGTFSDFIITWEEQFHHVTTICNSTISNFNFTDTYNGSTKAIFFNVTGEDETIGFCRIRIPTTLINNTFTVYVDGVNTTYTLLPRSNATHSYLYFTYEHSTKEVIIIPEFSSIIILPMIMVLISVATLLSKRKKLAYRNVA